MGKPLGSIGLSLAPAGTQHALFGDLAADECCVSDGSNGKIFHEGSVPARRLASPP
jgi:hypothetical protein